MPQFGNLFTYETISKTDGEVNWQFNKCTLLQDFDGFKMGDTVDAITIQLMILGWNEKDELILDSSASVNEANFPQNPFIQ